MEVPGPLLALEPGTIESMVHIKNNAKKVMETKPVSRLPLCFLLQAPALRFCHGFSPWRTVICKCKPSKLFLPQVALVSKYYHSNRKANYSKQPEPPRPSSSTLQSAKHFQGVFQFFQKNAANENDIDPEDTHSTLGRFPSLDCSIIYHVCPQVKFICVATGQ